MGLRSWLLEWTGRARKRDEAPVGHAADADATAGGRQPLAPAPPTTPGPEWHELPAYLPVDPAEHAAACVVASAIAAGDRPSSTFTIKRVSIANPEHRRVAAIATALAAGALETSSFTVKRIYRKREEEGSHAA